MERVLLLGSTGMLGRALYTKLKSAYLVKGVARRGADYNFDLLHDKELMRTIDDFGPDIIINCAAYVSIGGCEQNKDRAYLLNSRLPLVLGEVCLDKNIYFIHISTDHYYSNEGLRKHSESDKVCIVNEYARTKYIGESFLNWNDKALVVRTNFVGLNCGDSEKGSFLDWIIKCYESGEKMSLYYDYYTSGLFVDELCDYLIMLMNKELSGIYNLGSSEVYSKEDFACSLLKILYGRIPEYNSVSINSGNIRRANSLGLDVTKISESLGIDMPSMKDSLDRIVAEIRRKVL